PWIRAVRLQKRFPQTLSIAVAFREPRALIILSSAGGALAYVDRDGRVFGRASLAQRSDLPILSFPLGAQEPIARIASALAIIDRFETDPIGRLAQLSSLSWESERGFRAVATYRLRGREISRTVIDLGEASSWSQSSAAATGSNDISRLSEVLRYL